MAKLSEHDFCLWLSGYFQIRDAGARKTLTAEQVDIISAKLACVPGLGMDEPAGDGSTDTSPECQTGGGGVVER